MTRTKPDERFEDTLKPRFLSDEETAELLKRRAQQQGLEEEDSSAE